MKVDKQLKEECVAWLAQQGTEPAEPVETKSFTVEEAAKAERCEPATTKTDIWREQQGRNDVQRGLFPEGA